MSINRRRLLIAAGAAGLTGLAGTRVATARDIVWKGTALGADSQIIISGLDRATANRLIARATAEIERLENIFSIYRPESEVSRLNHTGRLEHPSHDFQLLLEQSLAFHRSTEGAFNIAIQPVWSYLARHFAGSQLPPPAGDLKRVLDTCDLSRLSFTSNRITIAPGMALTFNGIAQGYVTDVVAGLFRDTGLSDILISLGETYALPGKAWSIGIAGLNTRVELRDGAIAQSSGRGTLFTTDGRWHHLIDPRSGYSANTVQAVTVNSPRATEADALSTALFVASPDIRGRINARFPGVKLFWEGRIT